MDVKREIDHRSNVNILTLQILLCLVRIGGRFELDQSTLPIFSRRIWEDHDLGNSSIRSKDLVQ